MYVNSEFIDNEPTIINTSKKVDFCVENMYIDLYR